MFLIGPGGRTLLALRDTALTSPLQAEERYPVRSWRLLLPAGGALLAAVEAREPLSWRAAAARDTFSAVAFGDSLAISDILVAHSIRPLAADVRRRQDLDIDPSASLTLAPSEPLGLYYEIYGLQSDTDGFASFEVALNVKVESLNREGTILAEGSPLNILAQIADAWGFTIAGDDQVELRFSRLVDMTGRDRAVEYQVLDLNQAPAGDYEIRLRVYDEQGGRLAERLRRFTIRERD